jgi:hypothetical protein
MISSRMRLVGLLCILGGLVLDFFGVVALMTHGRGSGMYVAGFMSFFVGYVAVLYAAILIARAPSSKELFRGAVVRRREEQISALERSTLELRDLPPEELPLGIRIGRIILATLGCIMMGFALGEMNDLFPPLIIRGTAHAVPVPRLLLVFVEVMIAFSSFGMARVLRWDFVDRLEEAVKRGLTPVH